ncbi:MAG: 4'-phosphopantetheinyl transferase superfamily protein [Methanomethylovorans sp.]|jgi:4'-phosphopantetheinyl transferase|nr:4'-phosphopantetheinyl transferase superfamily protein [Methanomethylovorans sp.]
MHIEKLMPSIVPAEQVACLWKEYDVLIFLVDLRDYPVLDCEFLNEMEKIHFDTLKTEYFKKRYIISRIIIKYLCSILKERSWCEIVTYKNEYGRVYLDGYNDLYLCISYTEHILALSLSKIKVGIDIEVIRSRSITNISKSINISLPENSTSVAAYDFFLMWTLKEAYCKFSNETMFSKLNWKLDLSEVQNTSYIINDTYILSLITKVDSLNINVSYLEIIDFNKILNH